MSILHGGPNDGVDINSTHRTVETPVECTPPMICIAVYERDGDGYVFTGVRHRFEVGEDEYESRMESAADWTTRTAEERLYAPTNKQFI